MGNDTERAAVAAPGTAAAWAARWKILGFSAAVTVAVFLFLLARPNEYRSSATIKPVSPEQGRKNFAMEQLDAYGLSLGGGTKLEETEVLLRTVPCGVCRPAPGSSRR